MISKSQNDRYTVFVGFENEIRSLSKKLNYSVDDIVAAVQEVGFNEDEIEEYIRDRKDRG
jgi:hypothetical protein